MHIDILRQDPTEKGSEGSRKRQQSPLRLSLAAAWSPRELCGMKWTTELVSFWDRRTSSLYPSASQLFAELTGKGKRGHNLQAYDCPWGQFSGAGRAVSPQQPSLTAGGRWVCKPVKHIWEDTSSRYCWSLMEWQVKFILTATRCLLIAHSFIKPHVR